MSSDKNEILFKRFGVNYNNEEEIYKKGSVLYRQVCFPFFPIQWRGSDLLSSMSFKIPRPQRSLQMMPSQSRKQSSPDHSRIS